MMRSSCALFEGDLFFLLTSRGTFDVENRSRPDRRTCRRTDEAELQSGGCRELLCLRAWVSCLSGAARYPDHGSDAVIGCAVPASCGGDLQKAPWAFTRSALALDPALWNPRVAACCPGAVAAGAGRDRAGGNPAAYDLLQLRDLARERAGACS